MSKSEHFNLPSIDNQKNSKLAYFVVKKIP